MEMLDKKNTLQRLAELDYVALELGCGANKRISNAIGIDAIDYACVDIVGDAIEILKSFPCGSVDAVYSYHFFEHLPDVSIMLDEVARIMKPGGQMEVVVPHFSNPYFYSDYTHRSFFGLYTFSYLARDQLFRNKVPTYNKTQHFSLEGVSLIFKSPRPFYGRYLLKRSVGAILNSCSYMQEFYEENLCYIFPCYEIKYKLARMHEPT
jgi:ubiquinone/menaquinone biosynthesis C-methylase UbiE